MTVIASSLEAPVDQYSVSGNDGVVYRFSRRLKRDNITLGRHYIWRPHEDDPAEQVEGGLAALTPMTELYAVTVANNETRFSKSLLDEANEARRLAVRSGHGGAQLCNDGAGRMTGTKVSTYDMVRGEYICGRLHQSVFNGMKKETPIAAVVKLVSRPVFFAKFRSISITHAGSHLAKKERCANR